MPSIKKITVGAGVVGLLALVGAGSSSHQNINQTAVKSEAVSVQKEGTPTTTNVETEAVVTESPSYIEDTQEVSANESEPASGTDIQEANTQSTNIDTSSYSDGDKDCTDFATHAEAQAFFEAAGAGDPHRLDRDGDGIACETLP